MTNNGKCYLPFKRFNSFEGFFRVAILRTVDTEKSNFLAAVCWVSRINLHDYVRECPARLCSPLQYTHVAIQQIFCNEAIMQLRQAIEKKKRTRQLIRERSYYQSINKRKRKKEESKNDDAATTEMKMKARQRRRRRRRQRQRQK